MAILSVNEISGASHSVGEKGANDYSRKFKVVTSASTVGGLAVETATGIPRIGDNYATTLGNAEFDLSVVCNKVNCSQESDSPCLWIVTADYGPPTADEQQQNE